MKAYSKGFSVGEACSYVLDPLKRELTRQWKEVGRRAGMRPVMAEVVGRLAPELQDFEMSVARYAKPVEQASPQEEVKSLRKQVGDKDREIASLKRQLAGAGGGGGGGAGALEAKQAAFNKERQEWEAKNPGMCIFMDRHDGCRLGDRCKHATTHPGHKLPAKQ